MKPLYELLAQLLPILALGIIAFVVNVLLHELGHAIPKLFWTKGKVLVFIGSLGDPEGSLRLPLGRLEIYLNYNPFSWIRGLCQGEQLPLAKRIFSIAMGPLVSLLLTVIPFILLKTTEPDEHATVILVTFMVIGGMFTLSSAIPRGQLIATGTGGGVRNDAMQIIQLWKTRKLPDVYWEAMDKLGTKQYAEAAALLETSIHEGHASPALYRLAAAAQFHAGEYVKAQDWMEKVRQEGRFSTDDHITDGSIKVMLGRYREAVFIYRELVRENFNHFLILNNMGYSLIAAGEPENALVFLNRGLTLAPKFTELYANRAWAKIELGQWEEGLADAQQALKRNEACAGAYRVLGLYGRQMGDLATAREHLLKARSIEPRMPFLDEPLADVERRLQLLPEREV